MGRLDQTLRRHPPSNGRRSKHFFRYLGDGTNGLVLAIAADLKAGKKFPELIAAAGENGDVILIEGHSRATAYALAGLPELVECILGTSPTMRNWAAY
ncbi:MAG TPA: hypothetical protein VN950_08325 [Terriglobales bacterium]|nr:hypothetical protein [Terriglobales bacterium]